MKTTTWSGGTTTELLISPEKAVFSDLDFDFRLSTATVEVETSTFTPLPGVSRTLLVLDGQMALHHEGHHSSELGKFDIDKFQGDWNTHSKGKCTDFNLMTRGLTNGDIVGLNIKKDERLDHVIESSADWFFIYVFRGLVEVVFDQETRSVEENELFSLRDFNDPKIQIKGDQTSDLVIGWIQDS